jgi:hypothetical protein
MLTSARSNFAGALRGSPDTEDVSSGLFMCRECFERELKSQQIDGLEKDLKIAAPHEIDVICTREELNVLVKNYGRECCKCNKTFYKVVEFNPDYSYLMKIKYL